METKFSWLHFSDIHVGMTNQGWKWPVVENLLVEDLKHLIDKNGSLDLVVFSGDMTQSGKVEEYQGCTKILRKLWNVFESKGVNPHLFCVPGNHDLQRPDEMNPYYLGFSAWWQNGKLREEFWGEKGKKFLRAQKSIFNNYKKWIDSLSAEGIPVVCSSEGFLPGDSSAVLDNGKVRVGLIGLNSTWLQLGGGDYQGKLHVDPRQLLAITDNQPDEWVAKNDLNLLVTHHPLDWLNEKSIELFDREIDIAGRFQAHLYGHMHEPAAVEKAFLGLKPKRSIQSASLFGLEFFGNQEKRIHGYSWCSIVGDDFSNNIQMWPRTTRLISGGQLVMRANAEMPINNDNYIEHSFSLNDRGGPTSEKNSLPKLSEELPSTINIEAEVNSELLSSMEERLIECPQALRVREVMLQDTVRVMTENRFFWLVAEWGLGDRGFVWAIREKQGHKGYKLYSINVSNYKNKKDFLENFKQLYGHSFAVMCQQLANEKAYLIFDEIPFPMSLSDSHAIQVELEDLAGVVKSYCPDVFVILRSRQRPPSSSFAIVELSALNQVDVRSYVESHSTGAGVGLLAADISRIYSHTSGWPNLIDNVLANLKVASLSTVITSSQSSELGDSLLARAILELASSDDDILQRSYLLLKVLSVFSCGEELQNVKNFIRGKPAFPDHARVLLERGFIRTIDSLKFDNVIDGDFQKKLVVSQPVREWLHSKMATTDLKKLYESAAAFYFGAEWNGGIYKPSAIYRFDKHGRQTPEIENAKLILLRLAQASKDDKSLKNIHSLVSGHGAALMKGGYYKSACDLFSELLPFFGSRLGISDFQFTCFLYARSLRMIDGDDNSEKAAELLETAIPHLSGKSVLLSAKINLALTYQSLESNGKALDVANEIIKIGRRSVQATMARQLIVELSEEEDVESKLLELEAKARKEKQESAIFNISMSRAKFIENPEEKSRLLNELIKKAKDGGKPYNLMRAVVALGRLYLENKIELDVSTRRLMVRVYHYLYNESNEYSFGRLHKILWKIFSESGDAKNLLQLFQYSSLHWRLNGDSKAEMSCLKSMKYYFADRQRALEESPQASAYYAARLGANLER